MEYSYKVYDQDMKIQEGKIQSSDLIHAKVELQEKGYRIIHINEIQSLKRSLKPRVRFQTEEMALLFQEMALYIEAGLDVHIILDLVSENYRGEKKRRLLEIRDKLEKGEDFSKAMEESRLFPGLVSSMVAVGEINSRLGQTFRDLAKQYDREARLRKKFTQVLSYPVILIITSLVIVRLILKFVLPIFLDIFSSSQVPLPWMTRALVALAFHFEHFGSLYLILLIILLLVLLIGLRKSSFKYQFDKFIYTRKHLFFLYRVRFQLFFLQTLHMQLNNSIPIVNALENSKHLTENTYIKRELQGVINSLRTGTNFNEALKNSKLLPERIIFLIRSGEMSSSLSEALNIGTKILDQKLEDQAQKVQTYLEPALIILISLFVGFIVISIAIPMFDLVNYF